MGERKMNPVEIIALLTALIVPVKLIILMRSQRFWFKNVTSNYWVGSGNTTMIASFIVSIASLYFLLQELTIIQVWAALFFSMALISMALAPFSKYLLEVENRWFTETNTVKKGWLSTIVWVAISAWVLIALFT
jgi:hypothetical protein